MGEPARRGVWEPVKRALALARERPGWVAVLKWLVVLTVLAALPVDPQGPYDARTYERARGFRLEFPASGAIVEPLAAPGHAIAGAPDILVAAISTVVWVFLVAAGLTLLREVRGGAGCGPRRASWRVALGVLARGAAAAGVFLVYIAFAALVRLPSWRLEHDAPEILVADLQTHTFGSHDGVISARRNLEWHAGRGFDVAAVTEHDDATGAFEAWKLAAFFSDGLPAVIPGVEIRSRRGAYLLALGLDPRRGPEGGLTQFKGREDLFCHAVHTLHGGAVLALAWKLDVEDVGRLAAAGVDGFEIANAGHPDVPPEVRGALLEAAEAGGLVLVASSDWHGWGGFWRTWTAVRVRRSGNAGTSVLVPQERADAVLAAVRERRAEDIVPLVAGRLGPPSAARAVLAPLVEPLRYACELSAARVASWWVWAGIAALAAELFRRRGLRPGRALLALLLGVLGSGLLWRGGALIWAKAAGMAAHSRPALAGGAGVGIGLVSVAAAAVLVAREVRRTLRHGEDPRTVAS